MHQKLYNIYVSYAFRIHYFFLKGKTLELILLLKNYNFCIKLYHDVAEKVTSK